MSQPQEPTPAAFRNPVLRYFAATRPAFISATVVACLVGLAAASHDGIPFNGTLAVVTLLFAFVAHAGINVLNDYYDALSGTDDRNTDRIFPLTGGSRFIQNGVMGLAETRDFGFALLASVVAGGLWLMAHSTPQLAWVGLLGLFIGWAYSATSTNLNGRGMGEVCVILGFLAIVVGTDMVQRGAFSWTSVAMGLSYALITASLLFVTQFPDREADAAAGKRHWVARLGTDTARRIYPVLAATAYLWLALAVIIHVLPPLALLAFLATPLSVKAGRELLQHAAQPKLLADAIKLTIAAVLAHGSLLAVGLFISKGTS